MHRLVARLAGVLLVFTILHLGAARADTLDNILKAGVMRIATNPDFPPYGFTNKDQQLVGYDTEVAALIARDLGVKLELVAATAPSRIPYLQTRKVDLIIASLSMTPERMQAVDFSAPYGAFFSGIYGPKSLSLVKAEDLASKSIAVVRGTPPDIELSKMAPASLQIMRFDDNNLLATAYITRQVALIAAGSNMASAIETRTGEKPDPKIMFSSLPIGIGIIKGEARTKERLDAIIASRRSSGELDTLSKKWFGLPIPEFK